LKFLRLTSKLTGWRVDIQKSGEPVSFETQRESAIAELAEVLDITEEVATTLVSNGFLTTEGIMEADIPYLQQVTGLDEQTVRGIWAAAQAASGVVEEESGE
jgi:N utilization substance protein A